MVRGADGAAVPGLKDGATNHNNNKSPRHEFGERSFVRTQVRYAELKVFPRPKVDRSAEFFQKKSQLLCAVAASFFKRGLLLSGIAFTYASHGNVKLHD